MLVFDRFPSYTQAGSFADAVRKRAPELRVIIASSPLSDPIDALVPGRSLKPEHHAQVTLTDFVFPFEVAAPIVYVRRPDVDDDAGDGDQSLEAQLEQLVESFGGYFAGT